MHKSYKFNIAVIEPYRISCIILLIIILILVSYNDVLNDLGPGKIDREHCIGLYKHRHLFLVHFIYHIRTH
jgi:hypothetical protein